MNENNKNEILNKYIKSSKENKQIVTVFLTSSNRAKYIDLAIESILQQEYSNFCFIILDNNSTDGTQEIVQSYDDERIYFIQRESTLESLNCCYAFSICVTKYMVVFHDDDIVDKKYLSTMIEVMENNDYHLLSPSFATIDEQGKILYSSQNRVTKKYQQKEYLIDFLTKKEMMPLACYPANFYRTDFYKDIHKFLNIIDAGPACDQLMVFQTERYGGRICILKDILFYYRYHINQSSVTLGGIMELQLFQYLYDDEYYKEIIASCGEKIYKYFWHAYKLLVANYSYNKNREEIKRGLQICIVNCQKKGAKLKLIYFLYWMSYYFFDYTVVPLTFFRRLKTNIRKIELTGWKIDG